MALRINVLRYNRSLHVLDVNRLSFEKKTGPIHLALRGLTAGWLAGWLADRRNVGGSQNL